MEIGRACPVYQIFNLAVCAKKQKKSTIPSNSLKLSKLSTFLDMVMVQMNSVTAILTFAAMPPTKIRLGITVPNLGA